MESGPYPNISIRFIPTPFSHLLTGLPRGTFPSDFFFYQAVNISHSHMSFRILTKFLDCLRHLNTIRLGDIWVAAINIKNTDFLFPGSQGAAIRLFLGYYTTVKPVFHKGLRWLEERYSLSGVSFCFLCFKSPSPPILVFWQVPLRGHEPSSTLTELEHWKYKQNVHLKILWNQCNRTHSYFLVTSTC